MRTIFLILVFCAIPVTGGNDIEIVADAGLPDDFLSEPAPPSSKPSKWREQPSTPAIKKQWLGINRPFGAEV